MTSSTARANAATRRPPVSLMIATPAYDGKVVTDFVLSLMGTVDLLRSAGIGIKWGALGGQALLPRARGELAAEFLSESNASHLLFIDADMAWDPHAVMRLLQHDLDLVCGAAPSREEAAAYFACRPVLREDGTLSVDARTGCVECEFAGTGFMLARRGVFERMAAAHPELKFAGTEGREPAAVRQFLYDFFGMFACDGILLNEDVAFCRRWRDLGGRIFVDPDVELGHVGHKTYVGKLRDMMQPMRAAAAA